MKKLLMTMLSLLFLLCLVCASAEGIAQIETGTRMDFDGDGVEETFTFIPGEPDEYGDINGFSVYVEDQGFIQDGAWNLSGNAYALRLGYGDEVDGYRWGTLFMVSEYGPSDDPYSYCFLYANGTLTSLGGIAALPEDMKADRTGRIETTIRADCIGTWWREAEFKLAAGIRWNEEGDCVTTYALAEVPHTVYPMGMVVTLIRDLPLSPSAYDLIPTVTLAAGQDVVLAATDDVSRLYVTDMNDEVGGWVAMTKEDYMDSLIIDGAVVAVDEVFENILYAD